ncbi:MAG: methyltransferase-like protein [Parcubacteria group bacterium Gr01-1014_33]|nr:MAG: methyltransferase-like protein [Parcubacteria group bacterium Gr01-1014_33]
MPLANAFRKEGDTSIEKKYDLSVGFCPICFLVQLLFAPFPEELFLDYVYTPSVSSSTTLHFKKTAHALIARFNLGREHILLEVGSNDGTFLKFFKECGIGILGVDPAKNIAEAANRQGLTTLPEFFSQKLAKKLVQEKGVKANLVFGANVLAHVPEIVDFVQGVKTILAPSGTAVFEFPYVRGLMENKFDTIYHEHIFYYSLLALQNLFTRADLEVYDIEMVPTQGGSLRIFVSHTGAFPITNAVETLAAKEQADGFTEEATYQKIGRNVELLKEELRILLQNIKKEGKRIAGYSAPAKGNILLNYFGIGKEFLEFLVDKSELKQGLLTPGTNFYVYPLTKIYEEKPDYLLVLCWNIADEVVELLDDYKKAGGKFIIPIPEIRII